MQSDTVRHEVLNVVSNVTLVVRPAFCEWRGYEDVAEGAIFLR